MHVMYMGSQLFSAFQNLALLTKMTNVYIKVFCTANGSSSGDRVLPIHGLSSMFCFLLVLAQLRMNFIFYRQECTTSLFLQAVQCESTVCLFGYLPICTVDLQINGRTGRILGQVLLIVQRSKKKRRKKTVTQMLLNLHNTFILLLKSLSCHLHMFSLYHTHYT